MDEKDDKRSFEQRRRDAEDERMRDMEEHGGRYSRFGKDNDRRSFHKGGREDRRPFRRDDDDDRRGGFKGDRRGGFKGGDRRGGFKGREEGGSRNFGRGGDRDRRSFGRDGGDRKPRREGNFKRSFSRNDNED